VRFRLKRFYRPRCVCVCMCMCVYVCVVCVYVCAYVSVYVCMYFFKSFFIDNMFHYTVTLHVLVFSY